jgi:hypothetical protein
MEEQKGSLVARTHKESEVKEMEARLALIVASVIIPLIAGCGEDSDELLWGQSPFVTITSPADQSEVFVTTKITVDAVDAMDNTAMEPAPPW